jgi:hypothetical protein
MAENTNKESCDIPDLVLVFLMFDIFILKNIFAMEVDHRQAMSRGVVCLVSNGAI